MNLLGKLAAPIAFIVVAMFFNDGVFGASMIFPLIVITVVSMGWGNTHLFGKK